MNSPKRNRRAALVGKIARLPLSIREEINRRLLDGEAGHKVLAWVNAQPEAIERLRDFPGARPLISHQNLSEWRKSGYRNFLELRERAESMLAVAKALPGKSACPPGFAEN